MVIVEFSAHFLEGKLSSLGCFFAAFDYEFKSLIQLVLDLFSIFEVLFGMLLKVFKLLFAICMDTVSTKVSYASRFGIHAKFAPYFPAHV